MVPPGPGKTESVFVFGFLEKALMGAFVSGKRPSGGPQEGPREPLEEPVFQKRRPRGNTESVSVFGFLEKGPQGTFLFWKMALRGPPGGPEGTPRGVIFPEKAVSKLEWSNGSSDGGPS